MNPYTGVVYNYVPLPGAEQAIFKRISDISVSMKTLDYLDMPESVMVNHYVDMDPDDRDVYDAMRKELLVEVIDDPQLPVLCNINIGHALPHCIMPFGMDAAVDADEQVIRFKG